MALDGMEAYMSILLQSLDSKWEVMQEIEEKTKEQEEVLSIQELDMDRFERLMDQKEECIQKLDELDRGFETIFGKIKGDLEANKQAYRPYIERMQERIRNITDVSVGIQAMEQKNKEALESYLTNHKESIKNYKRSNQTAASYYKNMVNQHQSGQSYFLNKKR